MKKLMTFIRNQNISLKFASTYFIILLLQIILTGIYLYIQASDSTINQAAVVMEQNLMQTKSAIMEKAKIIENSAVIISYNENIQNFLEYEYENNESQVEDYQFRISPIIGTILNSNKSISVIRIYMNNAVVSEKLTSFYSVNSQRSTDAYNRIIKMKPSDYGWVSTRQVEDNAGNKEEVISYFTQITSSNTYGYIGAVDIQIQEKVFFDILRNNIMSSFGKVFIVDNKNQIVSNNIGDLYKKNISDIGVKNFTINQKINSIENVDGVKSMIISIPIEEIGCSVVGVFPISSFNNKVKESISNIILVLLISSLFLGVIIYLTTNLLLSRIKKLVKAMKQVREGNLDVAVEIGSMDEIGELSLTFNHMTERIHDLVETVYKIQIMEREAELKALEAQINPHFLYNTLSTISWIARKGNIKDVTKITNSLAKFYRLVLNKGRTIISVKEEVDIVEAYLYIQKIRFEDTLNVVFDVDENIYDYKIAKNILQPIVENALNHGIEPKRGNSTIIIKAGEYNNKLFFKVIDDGIGMTEDRLKKVLSGNVDRTTGSGYAINNIMERLKAYYGIEYSFDIFSKHGIGTEIAITIEKYTTR